MRIHDVIFIFNQKEKRTNHNGFYRDKYTAFFKS